jgi:hypothetical protein
VALRQKGTAMVRITDLRTADCDSCDYNGELRPSGKSFVTRHKVNGDFCMGRPKTAEVKPAPGKRVKEEAASERTSCAACSRRDLAVKAGKLVIHKDFKLNARCPGSLTPPSEVKATDPKPPAQPKPKPKGEKRPKLTITDEAKAMAKAARFGQDLKPHGWRTTFETNTADVHPWTGEPIASVTAVAKRGQHEDTETMRITWWGAACIGGDDRITWEFKGRQIAVRNAKACRDRAARSHEELTQESYRIAVRKAATPGKKGKGGLRPLPFDPKTVSDEELLDRIVGRTLTWARKLDDKQETHTVKPNTKPRITRPKSNPDERTVTVTTPTGQKSFHLSRLVSIG